jgi:hypothetical protein
MQIREPALQFFNLLMEDDVMHFSVAIEQIDMPLPIHIGEIAQDGHERCDSNSRGEQCDTI